MCTICGDTGYRPAIRYDGGGANPLNMQSSDYAIQEPCPYCAPRWPVRLPVRIVRMPDRLARNEMLGR
ncbi:MAG: hypothetical protein FWD12_08515 [Alphaproteobacteria bacterium]|nr:hypothetical protein [Alphaproteobacteria bacterium]